MNRYWFGRMAGRFAEGWGKQLVSDSRLDAWWMMECSLVDGAKHERWARMKCNGMKCIGTK